MATYFEKLSQVEAQALFDRYLTYRGERIDFLRREYEREGNDSARDLDGTRESLVPLWRWAIAKLQLRDMIYAPDWLDEYGKLIVNSFEDWLPKTMEATLLDAIAFYFADVCIALMPGVRWQVCRFESIDINQPVLDGFVYSPHQPRRVLQHTARLVIDRKAGDDALLAAFHRLERQIGPSVE